jgi:hypothetical protein
LTNRKKSKATHSTTSSSLSKHPSRAHFLIFLPNALGIEK